VRVCPLLLFFRDDADFAVSFEHGGFDLVEPAQALIARLFHNVVVLDAHPAHGAAAPLVVFKKDERCAVHDLGEAVRTGTRPGKTPMREGDGDDLAEGVGDRSFIGDDGREHHAAEKKDEDEFEGCELFAGPASDDAHDEDKKKVAVKGPKDRFCGCDVQSRTPLRVRMRRAAVSGRRHRQEGERQVGKRKAMGRKRRPAVFSATKAVKANARERLGTPPPSAAIPDRRNKAEHGPVKHKKTVEEVVAAARRGEEL
jgi:hypothetical protein